MSIPFESAPREPVATLASKADWDRAYRDTRPYAVSRKDQIGNWLLAQVPPTRDGRCLEIGCYPGRFLPLLGSLGYELNGIDMQASVAELPGWLREQGCRAGEFVERDFFVHPAKPEFDLVISLGFVEHFENWQEVLRRHADFVKPCGLLVVEAPNFLGCFQHWFHSTFDWDNLACHHLPAMDPELWADVLRDLGYEIVFAGYFGRFHVWGAQEGLGWWKRKALKFILRARNVLKHLIPQGTRSFSPYAGLVARRPSQP